MPNSRRSTVRRFAFLFSASLLALQPVAAGTISIPFDPANFSNPLNITNQFLAFSVGKKFVYRSQSPDGCEQIEVTVTNKTESIAAGVTAREVRDIVYEDENCDGSLNKIEDTKDWYAQDNAGNVWYLGEDTKDCDGNKCTINPGSWEAGADIFNIGSNGVAGIIMLANPQNGDNYQQEFYEGHAEDVGAVVGTDVTVTLTRPDALQPKVFNHCLKTKERSTLEAGSTAHKYYCPNIGLVLEEDLSGGTVRTELIDPSAISTAFQFREVR